MSAIDQLAEVFADSFMAPVIEHAAYFEVETENGTEIVPGDIVSLPFNLNFAAGGRFYADACAVETWKHFQRAFKPYVSGDEISEVAPRIGYICRLSASGYMDCTDWSAFDTEEEAAQYLIDTYGE